MNEKGKRTILRVSNLTVTIKNPKRPLRPVRGVSFCMEKAQRVCLVGESGCGKTMTAFSIMRLLPEERFTITGQIEFDGKDILSLPLESMRPLRGKDMAMVFQEPMTALNPVLSIGFQIKEAVTTHKMAQAEEARSLALSTMARVGIPEPELVYNQYPHELSGGLRQRVMIAMALVCNPKLLIADEPTTALDVSIQAQILDLICNLSTTMDLALLLISHNLGVVAHIAQRVMVMYAGTIVEDGPVKEIFDSPIHPYTRGLLASVPFGENMKRKRLSSIPGRVPSLDEIPEGCAFQNRCRFAMDVCERKAPILETVSPSHKVACHLARELSTNVSGPTI